MPKGYRCAILAAVGLLIISAAPPPNAQAERDQAQAQKSIAASLSSIAATHREQIEQTRRTAPPQPCGPGEYQSKDELCAQWKAADAAQLAAWLSGASFVGVLIALYLAFQSNRIARKTGEAQVRAYLTVEKVEIQFSEMPNSMIRCTIRNSGQSPAFDVRWSCVMNVIYNNEGRRSPEIRGSLLDTVETIVPQGSHQFLPVQTNFELNDAELLFLAHQAEGVGIHCKIIAVGVDVFDKKIETERNFIAVLENIPAESSRHEMRPMGTSAN